MQRDLTQLFIVIAIVVTGFVAVTFLSSTLEHQRVPVPAAFADSDLALEGKRLNGYALGSEGLLADWYWMMSLQYMGKKMIEYGDKDIDLENLSSLNIRLLYPYLDNATDLDPKFYAAYSYGAAVLPAINREHAIALIEKGIANNPEQWRFYQYLGYIYWRSKNFDKAAETY
ncbi:MAG TPA: hypothetical protein VK612_07575, partial [Pyrinomonadaceae bacterium]|nr:hypothetical protein [Pyrinomonadaceae bacterium]